MIIKTGNKIINTDCCSEVHGPDQKDNEKLLNDIFIAMASGVKYAEIIDGELIPFEGEESANET